MNIGYAISYLWDVFAKPQSVGAVFVIIFVQYRSIILYFVKTAMKDGILQTLFDLILNLADVIRGYYHMSNEIVRGLVQNYVFSYVDEGNDSNYAEMSSLQRESGNFQNNDATNIPGRNKNHKLSSSSAPLPQLVEVRNSLLYNQEDAVALNSGTSTSFVSVSSRQMGFENEMAPLEPAFLNKDEYPTGWLVFHPILGISSLQEVDQYEKEQRLRKVNTNARSEIPKENLNTKGTEMPI